MDGSISERSDDGEMHDDGIHGSNEVHGNIASDSSIYYVKFVLERNVSLERGNVVEKYVY